MSTIGEIIAEAMDKVGKDGTITVEEAKASRPPRRVEGMQFDKGYLSPYFVTDPESMEAVMRTPSSSSTRRRSATSRTCCRCWRKSPRANRPFLIIAEDVEGEALATLVVNKLRGTLNVAAVKAPGFGDRRKAMLEDIAVLTGGKVITEDLGVKLENVEIDDLGSAKRSRSTRRAPPSSKVKAAPPISLAASARSAARSRRPPPTTIARSSRSASPSSLVVSPSSTSVPLPRPR